MIERILYDVLTERVAWFLDVPSRLDSVFQPEGEVYRVPPAELAAIKAGLTTRRPVVRHGFATSPAEVPCIAIVLANEQPEKMFLDDFASSMDGDPDQEALGVIESRSYSLICYGHGTDYTRYLYKLLKHSVLSKIRYLKSVGVNAPTFTGADIEPAAAYLPDRVFTRVLMLRCQVEEYYYQVNHPVPFVGSVEILRDDVGGDVVPVEVTFP